MFPLLASCLDLSLHVGGNATSRVRGFTPASASDQPIHISSVTDRWQTSRLDVDIECNGCREFNKSNIINQCPIIIILMNNAIVGGDFNTVGFTGCSHVMSSSHDIKVRSTISTVSSSYNPVLRDESTTAEPCIVNEESYLPGPLVRFCLNSTNNPALSLGWWPLNSTSLLQVIFASHL